MANNSFRQKSELNYKTPPNMAFYDKSDLSYEYAWTEYSEIDLQKKTLNPEEGYEVLYFINGFAEKHHFVNKMTGMIIERLIKNHLPENLNCNDQIMEWLENSG